MLTKPAHDQRMNFHHTFIATFVSVFAILASSCNGNHTGTQSGLEASLDSLFTSMFPSDEPGAIVLAAKGDSIVFLSGYGKARLDSTADIDPTVIFNICSISKQFSAIALLKLQEQGHLSLDDTVAGFFPEFHSPLLKKITLRQMMSHTSGIPDTRPRTEKEWNKYRKNHRSIYDNVDDFMHYALCDESVRYLADLDTLAFEPGTKYEYQNPTFQLVLPIVERVTGVRFEKWMHDNIFVPAGMNNTIYLRPEIPLSNYAHGYIRAEGPNNHKYFRSRDGKWEESDYGEANFFPTKADGGIYTTAEDFFKWERALFDGKVISKESLNQALTPHIQTNRQNEYYGLGLFLLNKPDGTKSVYHTGDNGGFYTFERYDLDSDIFYLVFANRNDWDRYDVMDKMENIFAQHKL